MHAIMKQTKSDTNDMILKIAAVVVGNYTIYSTLFLHSGYVITVTVLLHQILG